MIRIVCTKLTAFEHTGCCNPWVEVDAYLQLDNLMHSSSHFNMSSFATLLRSCASCNAERRDILYLAMELRFLQST